jgi:hypothetical protein
VFAAFESRMDRNRWVGLRAVTISLCYPDRFIKSADSNLLGTITEEAIQFMVSEDETLRLLIPLHSE